MQLKIKRPIIMPEHAVQNENKIAVNIYQPNTKASFHHLSKTAKIPGISKNILVIRDKFTTIFP